MSATQQQNYLLAAEYKQKRAEENGPLIFRVSSIMAFIASSYAVVHGLSEGAGTNFVISVLIILLLWAGVLVLRFTAFGKANPEEISTALATAVLLLYRVYGQILYFNGASSIRTTLDECGQHNVTVSSSTGPGWWKNFSDVYTLHLSGDYCSDVARSATEKTFIFGFALWITFTMIFVLLVRLRFRHSLVVAGVPGVVLMILTNYYMVTVGRWSLATVVGAGLLLTYVPGLSLCLMWPHVTEKLHFATFLLNREKDMRLMQQRTKIRVQSKMIAKTKEQLAEAQKVVDKVMAQGGTVLDQYAVPYSDLIMGGALGEGSFGTVYKAKLKRGARETTVAVKTMRVDKVTAKIMDKFRGEIYIMAPLCHPNLVRLYGAVWNEGPDKLCIVLEYVEKGSLEDVLVEGGTWAYPRFGFAHGLAKCFRYLHHELLEPVMHRDLKPANVLVGGNMESKVADFGESKALDGAMTDTDGEDALLTQTYVGTQIYMVFAFSLVLLEISVGNPYHVHKHMRGRTRLAYNLGYRPPIPDLLLEEQPELVSLIEEGWATDPSDRPEFLSIEPRLAALNPNTTADDESHSSSVLRQRSSKAALFSVEEEANLKEHFASSTKKFSAFLSHHKAACAAEARLVKGRLDKVLGKDSFLDSDNLHDLRSLLDHVLDSDVLVLFQSKEVLQRPWCLLELYTAVTNGVPIVTLNCVGKGYDFGAATDFLTHLETSLKTTNPDALNVLAGEGVDPLCVAHVLSSAIPKIVSINFNVSGTENSIKASLADLAKTMASASSLPVPTNSFESWLTVRAQRDREAMEETIECGTIRGTMRGRMLAKVERADELEAELKDVKQEAKVRVDVLEAKLEKRDARIDKLEAKIEKLEKKLGL